jgi:nucleotide-binding universal stress UspA family protein
MNDSPPRPIVVGVDGSPASVEALRWAAGVAQTRHCELVAVGVWEPHAMASYAPSAVASVDARERAEHALTTAVRDVAAAAPSVRVRQVPAAGLAARVLLRQAQGADLLVLGGRRHATPFTPAAGPVALACLRCAPCPVVVVGAPVPRPRLLDAERADQPVTL